jgi:hypothetical protein
MIPLQQIKDESDVDIVENNKSNVEQRGAAN